MEIPKWVDRYRKDLEFKNYCTTTIDNYTSQVKSFLSYMDGKFTEPAKVNATSIKDWVGQGKARNSVAHRLSALKLFYKLTVGQPMKIDYIEYPRKEKKLPQPLDISEISAIINACPNLKHKAIICLMYSSGLRISEVINLKIAHVDGKKQVINIIAGKGKKDRIVMLPESLLNLLRQYYKQYRPVEYLFNGQNSPKYSERSINQFLIRYAKMAGVKRHVHAHLLRHSYATHSLEHGTDLRLIQKVLGHTNPKTTEIYTHVTSALVSKIYSPLSQIQLQP